MAKYEVKQAAVSQVLADVRSDKIEIPELQRPIVWKTFQDPGSAGIALKRISGRLLDHLADCRRQTERGTHVRITNNRTLELIVRPGTDCDGRQRMLNLWYRN